MKTCSECGGEMDELSSKTQEGVGYVYFKCKKCGDEILSMGQLHHVAEKYREMKRFRVKLNKWGLSLGLRIPQEIVSKYNLKEKAEVCIAEEDNRLIVTVA